METAIRGRTKAETTISGSAMQVLPVYPPQYTGPTVITPTSSEQVLATSDKTILTDIIIEPIPSNYGLITWNGSTLTVS